MNETSAIAGPATNMPTTSAPDRILPSASAIDRLEAFADSPWFFPAWLAVVMVILFHDAVGPDCLFAYRDSAHFYPPLYKLVREEWLAGRVPLWNPLLNNGQPLAGMATSGAFYPPQVLLTLLLPDGQSLNVLVILHLAFAATGGYLLARFQGLSRPAATLAGLTYGFGGSVLLQIYNPIYACGAAWLVWAVLGGVRLLAGGGLRDFLLLATSLAFSVLCGEPQAGYHAGLVLALWWLFRPTRSWRGLAALGLAAGAGGLLSLVQIALAAEFTAETSRAMDLAPQSIWQVPEFVLRSGQSPDRANWYDILIGRPPKVARHYSSTYGFTLLPWRIVELVWPGFSGPPHGRWTITWGFDTGTTWANSLYAGLLPALAPAALGLVRVGRPGNRRFWLWLLAASFVASFGAYGIVGLVRNAGVLATGQFAEFGYRAGDEIGGPYWLLSILAPGYSGFRYPVKWMTVFTLALGQIAGFVVDASRDAAVRRRLSTAALITAATIAVATLGLAAAVSNSEGRWSLVFGGLQAVAASGVLVWFMRPAAAALPPAAVAAMLVGLTATDIGLAGRRDMIIAPFSAIRNASGYLAELADGRLPAVAAASPRLRVAALGSPGQVGLSDPRRYAAYLGMVLMAHVPMLHGCDKFGETSTAMPRDTEALCNPSVKEGATTLPRRTYDLAAVEYFLIPNDRETLDKATGFLQEWSRGQKAGQYEGPAPAGGDLPVVDLHLPGEESAPPLAFLARNDSALPRARIVRRVAAIPPISSQAWDRWIDALKRIAFPNPEVPDLFHAAVVEAADPRQSVISRAAARAGDGRPRADACRIVLDESQRVVVEADLAEPGVVVLADTYHPDWSVMVSSDGGPPRPLPILRTNRIHRGVSLPEGRHMLEFRYRSRTFARTWWITAAAWVAAAAVWVGSVRWNGSCRLANR
jgi:hypothetical protein